MDSFKVNIMIMILGIFTGVNAIHIVSQSKMFVSVRNILLSLGNIFPCSFLFPDNSNWNVLYHESLCPMVR